jgi:pyruvate-formate lyase-activating enzyme
MVVLFYAGCTAGCPYTGNVKETRETDRGLFRDAIPEVT